MTVSQLIAQLQECNLDAQVCTTYLPPEDGDLIIQVVTGVTDRGGWNKTEDRVSLDLE
jgi:hypothetical protein